MELLNHLSVIRVTGTGTIIETSLEDKVLPGLNDAIRTAAIKMVEGRRLTSTVRCALPESLLITEEIQHILQSHCKLPINFKELGRNGMEPSGLFYALKPQRWREGYNQYNIDPEMFWVGLAIKSNGCETQYRMTHALISLKSVKGYLEGQLVSLDRNPILNTYADMPMSLERVKAFLMLSGIPSISYIEKMLMLMDRKHLTEERSREIRAFKLKCLEETVALTGIKIDLSEQIVNTAKDFLINPIDTNLFRSRVIRSDVFSRFPSELLNAVLPELTLHLNDHLMWCAYIQQRHYRNAFKIAQDESPHTCKVDDSPNVVNNIYNELVSIITNWN